MIQDSDNVDFKNLHSNLYQNSPDPCRIIDIDGKIVHCNKSYLQFFGDNAVGQTIFDHIAEESHSLLESVFEQWKSGKPVTNRELWFKKQNGDKFLGLLSATGIYDDDKLIGSNTIIRDITEFALMKKELQSAKQKKQEIVGELSARIAHDFKNPLSVLKNSLTLLENQHSENQESSNLFLIMNRAITRIDHQINEVLEFVIPKPLCLENHSLLQIFENVLTNVVDLKHVSIHLPHQDLNINCDPKKMEVVFGNLLLNAVQAMKNHGKISVIWKETDTGIEIQVTDTGPGIPKKLAYKIFDPLFTTRQIGTGLGLPVCKTIIEEHGGVITFETDFGKGTTFVISLKK